jgi:hypothetical protein
LLFWRADAMLASGYIETQTTRAGFISHKTNPLQSSITSLFLILTEKHKPYCIFILYEYV